MEVFVGKIERLTVKIECLTFLKYYTQFERFRIDYVFGKLDDILQLRCYVNNKSRFAFNVKQETQISCEL